MGVLLDPNLYGSQDRTLSRDCPVISATTTLALGTNPQPTRVFQVELIVDTTYAADPSNFYVFALIWGSGPTTLATWSTLTGAVNQGTLTAGVPAQMVLSTTDTDLVIGANRTVRLLATKNGTAANIQPRVVVNGRTVAK